MKHTQTMHLLRASVVMAVAFLVTSTPPSVQGAFAARRRTTTTTATITESSRRSTLSGRWKAPTGDDRSRAVPSRGSNAIGFVPAVTSSSLSSLTAKTSTATDTEKEEEFSEGCGIDEVVRSKLWEALLFRLFGGKNDEDERGVFRPPARSMEGTVVVVTDAFSGPGLESAKRLALAGATVVVTAPTPELAAETAVAVRDYCRVGVARSGDDDDDDDDGGTFYTNPTPIVRGIELDLENLEGSVRNFPDRYRDAMVSLSKIRDRDDFLKRPNTKTRTIDVLVNHAGGLRGSEIPTATTTTTPERTVDGIERTFQSCYLGHFALTARLFHGCLLTDNGCTVINVSSAVHRCAVVLRSESPEAAVPAYGFDFDAGFDGGRGGVDRDPFPAYARAKLAGVVFARELQRRADRAAGTTTTTAGGLTAFSVEPGLVEAELEHAGPISLLLTAGVDRGANAPVWLAYRASQTGGGGGGGGQHFGENRNPVPVVRSAGNPESGERLWKLSEELAGLRFDPGNNEDAGDNDGVEGITDR